MEINFGKIYHSISKISARGHPYISHKTEEWPEEWRTVQFKHYPRFSRVPLPKNNTVNKELFAAIAARQSHRHFSAEGVQIGALSDILQFSCGLISANNPLRRAQPSGGMRYPIEVYPFVFKPRRGLQSGVFHYNVENHSLELLRPQIWRKEDFDKLFVYEWVKDASIVLILTAVFERTYMKYGDRGYRYILLEAGHIGQNVYLVSEALGIKCIALGGTRDESIEKLLDIDGVTESVVYALVLG